ncbi:MULTISPECIES: site-specific DNA-methyltransferase [Microbacterium]|uniref:Adenine-specific DNA-methyltransferase n=1 Tax=Microbacterium saccharophilum TaxID=1213358 RepID=A0A7Z7GC34_9MICO|nr:MULTISPECIES: site-specific DNA-methyltransferase [Microbacterium]SFI21426.1 adenine-specific DNA-methyltransferase [Microbacterium saccharophilum]
MTAGNQLKRRGKQNWKTMEKLRMTSPDLTQANIDKLAELFPTVITESVDESGAPRRTIDFDLLRQELSDHIVEGPHERYQLDWPGKRAAALAANAPIAKTLRPLREESVDFDTTKNLFIEGDNLDALKLLQESYLGKVKLIYIDPPYNTGKDFVYEDDFAESSTDYLRRSRQRSESGNRLVANTESNGRFHSDWLSMMYPRLRLARNLLADDGVIFISIDDNELANLVKLCSDVFGPDNHLATFIWKSKSGGANDSGEVAVDHEYVVCFSRSRTGAALGLDPDAVATTSYNNEDELGKYSLERLDKQNLQYSPSLDYDLIGPDGTVHRLAHKDPARPNAIWRWAKERAAREIDQLVFKDGNVYTKNYQKPGGKPRSMLVDERFGRTRTGSTEVRELLGGNYFDNPKPTKLLSAITAIATTKDAIVLDFFAGSGSLGHAVMALNARDGGTRRFVLVQLPERTPDGSDARSAGFDTIAEVSRRRLARAGEVLTKERVDRLRPETSHLDVGFRTLRVDSTNMVDLLDSPDDLVQASLNSAIASVKPGRTDEDLLFQVLLEWGLDLSLSVTRESMDGVEVLAVDSDALVACFSDQVTLEVVASIASRHPLRAVFRDSGFVDDAARINAEQLFREMSPISEVRSI